MEHFLFSDSFLSREPMINKEDSDHPKTISNRFPKSKLFSTNLHHFRFSTLFPRENNLGTRVKFAAATQVHFYLYRLQNALVVYFEIAPYIPRFHHFLSDPLLRDSQHDDFKVF